MSFIKHGISNQDWEAYSEGRLEAADRDHVEAHLIGCLACWEEYEQFKLTTQRLHEAGTEARTAQALSDEQLRQGLRTVYARIRAAHSFVPVSQPPQIHERLEFLETVLAPMCGSLTASKALRAAAHSSPARSLDQITTETWEPFLHRLTSIATVMCGETGAHLVHESGKICQEF